MDWTIDITDAAYKKMQAEPEYEKKRSRLAKAWGSKQQMAKASSAYESSIMTDKKGRKGDGK